ncbi:hypothetical protein LCGC14_1155440 [marine sediment metagenome]|uniref:Peptidase M15A C-terminal domain-containing protein n=1 Tax=marine sediment metagenome TaxID=412755 RepID=A0A0F9LZ35_9ZZZZ
MGMTAEAWAKRFFFFKPREFGIPDHPNGLRTQEVLDNMDGWLVLNLDALRRFVNKPIIIHAGYATRGHAKNSQHYLGAAADFHIEGMGLFAQYEAAQRFKFTGIGVYPFWSNPGLHVDVRPLKVHAQVEPGARWVKNEAGVYEPLTDSWLGVLLEEENK